MRYWHPTLFIAAAVGAVFSTLCPAAWGAYLWGDGDGERATFCTAVGAFAGPLLAGAVLAWRGRPVGLWLLRAGLVLCLPYPAVWWGCGPWAPDPAYRQLLADNARLRAEWPGR